MNQAQMTVRAALDGRMPVRYCKNTAKADSPVVATPVPATQVIFCGRAKKGGRRGAMVTLEAAKPHFRSFLKKCERCMRCQDAATSATA